jgi:hypothetical protein
MRSTKRQLNENQTTMSAAPAITKTRNLKLVHHRNSRASSNTPLLLASTNQFRRPSLIQYVVCEMRPLSTVEKPSFKALVERSSGRNVMCRKTLCKNIDDQCESMITNLREDMKTLSYVCTTADIWSVTNQRYLGMTCHWIDDNLGRHSVALASRRMIGRHI